MSIACMQMDFVQNPEILITTFLAVFAGFQESLMPGTSNPEGIVKRRGMSECPETSLVCYSPDLCFLTLESGATRVGNGNFRNPDSVR